MARVVVDLGTDEFTDLAEIGRGGFGVVYTARQPAFQRTVAIKVLTLTDERTLRRFDRERQALGKVSNHPHITPVFASGFTADGMPYLAMELMRGGSLADQLDRDGALPWPDVLDLGVKMAGAMETAHRAGILHRDLKPANILLSDFGEPRLADFGIASLDDGEQTKTGVITASVAYAAPEVLDGRRPEVPADVYGLAATLFTLAAGRPPFAASEEESILAMVLRVARDPVPDLRPQGVPDAFARVLETAMAKDVADRHPTAEAFGTALREAQRELRIPPTTMVLPRTADDAGLAGRGHDTVVLAAPASMPAFPPGAPRLPDQPTADVPGAPAPATPSAPAGDAPPPGAPTPPRRRTGLLVAGIAVLLLGVVGGVLTWQATRDDAPPAVVAATEGAAGSEEEGSGVQPATDPADGSDPTAGSEADPSDAQDGASGPAPGDWQAVRSMQVARQQIPAVTLQGTIWVTGGLTEDGVTASVEGYEPATNSWRTGPDLPVPVHHHMSAVYDGHVVVLGGWSPEGSLLSAVTSDRVLSLQGTEWVELPPLLQPRVAGVAAAVGDLLVVTGGQDESGQLLTTTEVFDGESWRQVADLPTPREHLAAASDGTHLYAVGGRQLSADANLAVLERYDPAADTWEALPDMPTPRGGLAAALTDGVLVAIGGEEPLGALSEVEAFDIAAGTWTSWPSLPTARHGLGASVSSGSLFTLGGALEATHSAPTADVEVVALR